MSEAELRIPHLPVELTRLLVQIPRGRVATYGDLADALGSRQAARWVGEFLVDHPHGDDCPCHRVVRQTGDLGLFIGGKGEKEARLRAEQIEVVDGKVDLARYRFTEFASPRPLASLVTFQDELPNRTKFVPYRGVPKFVGGVDVAYENSGTAIAAYVSVDMATGEANWSTTIRRPVQFPYIPSMLSFRESPLLLELLAVAREQGHLADVVMVDGNGMLHPRFAGIASHVGVLSGVRTIGIGKKLLCGSVDLENMKTNEARPVLVRARQAGIAMKANPGSRPIFVSPGHLIDVGGARRIVGRMFRGHRVPEPIFLADALSKADLRARRARRADQESGRT
jgi:deoxyribonuclease V